MSKAAQKRDPRRLITREEHAMPVYQRYQRGPDGKVLLDAHGKKVPWLDKHGTPRWSGQVFSGRNAAGTTQFLTKTFTRLKDAQQWVRAQETRKDKGDRPTADRRTLGAYLAWWLDAKAAGATWGKKKGQAPRSRTMADYRGAVERWITRPRDGLPRLGACRLDRLSYQTLEAFYDAMRAAGATPRAVQGLHGVLRQALEDPVRKGSLARNPCDWASVPRPKAKHHDGDADTALNAMTQEQAAKFLDAARQVRHSAFWHLLLLGGLRPCEALALRWPEVDFKAGTVRVLHSLVRLPGKPWTLEPPKTKHSRRTVPLPAVAMQQLKAWKAKQAEERLAAGPEWQDHGLVFTTDHGLPMWAPRSAFVKVMAAAGLGTWGDEPKREHPHGPVAAREFTPAFRIYDLRHTCATLLLLAGESLKVVSERLGHASIVMTADVYAHVLPTMQRAAADKLEVMFGSGA
jgi:integrase